jgi:hypothetical protein
MIRRISVNFIQIHGVGVGGRDYKSKWQLPPTRSLFIISRYGTSRCRREATHMHDGEARPEPPRQERIVGAAAGAAPPRNRSSALASLMSYGLWASTALLLGATRSTLSADEADPADQYGDFA